MSLYGAPTAGQLGLGSSFASQWESSPRLQWTLDQVAYLLRVRQAPFCSPKRDLLAGTGFAVTTHFSHGSSFQEHWPLEMNCSPPQLYLAFWGGNMLWAKSVSQEDFWGVKEEENGKTFLK